MRKLLIFLCLSNPLLSAPTPPHLDGDGWPIASSDPGGETNTTSTVPPTSALPIPTPAPLPLDTLTVSMEGAISNVIPEDCSLSQALCIGGTAVSTHASDGIWRDANLTINGQSCAGGNPIIICCQHPTGYAADPLMVATGWDWFDPARYLQETLAKVTLQAGGYHDKDFCRVTTTESEGSVTTYADLFPWYIFVWKIEQSVYSYFQIPKAELKIPLGATVPFDNRTLNLSVDDVYPSGEGYCKTVADDGIIGGDGKILVYRSQYKMPERIARTNSYRISYELPGISMGESWGGAIAVEQGRAYALSTWESVQVTETEGDYVLSSPCGSQELSVTIGRARTSHEGVEVSPSISLLFASLQVSFAGLLADNSSYCEIASQPLDTPDHLSVYANFVQERITIRRTYYEKLYSYSTINPSPVIPSVMIGFPPNTPVKHVEDSFYNKDLQFEYAFGCCNDARPPKSEVVKGLETMESNTSSLENTP